MEVLHAPQVLTAEGDRLPGQLVEAAATAAGLHLRTGCNCNPGRCLANLGITPEEVRNDLVLSFPNPDQGCNSHPATSFPAF